MNSVLMILLLTLLQFFCGLGILSLCRQQLKPALTISLSVLLGVAVFSLIPFLLQLFYVPLTATYVFISLVLAALLLNLNYRQSRLLLKNLFANLRLRIRLYEWPALLLILMIVWVSLWRCYYYPPTPRDLTSGAEVIAEYAVREKTMINSVFTVNLETTNNQFKPPFITSLQLVYKYAGFPFGQIWLGSLFVFFLVFLYHALTPGLHPFMAGLLLLFFLAIPEMYAYTFIPLFDYPNAIFFFLSVYFLIRFFLQGQRKNMVLSGILMAIATYVRSETLVLAAMMLLPVFWHHIRKWDSFTNLAISSLLFFLPALLAYLLSVSVYINYYLPVTYEVEGLVNSNLLDLGPLFKRFTDMNGRLLFSDYGVDLYGYFIFLFLLVIIFDHICGEGFSRESGNWFYAVLVIYFGYPILGFLLPLLDIDHSTKRGLFKIFPLMLLYMGTSTVLLKLSEQIRQWEGRPARPS